MKKRFTEEQITPILKEAEVGLPVKELCRKYNIRTRPSIPGARSTAAWKSAKSAA